MKTMVMISGGNGSGKSTLARALMNKAGGIASTSREITVCNDKRYAFAGKYNSSKYGGVDAINNTKELADIAEIAFKECEVFIAEGCNLGTFGMNMQNAFFKAQNQLLIFLYADTETIKRRLLNRVNTKADDDKAQKRLTTAMNRAKNARRAAVKWKSIGVQVVCVNTAAMDAEKCADCLFELINEKAKICH